MTGRTQHAFGLRRSLLALAVAVTGGALVLPAHANGPGAPGAAADVPRAAVSSVKIGHSGLPVPRFVALKKDEVRARFGPGFDYPVAAVYRRRGLPVRVVAETRDDVWRRIEDADGQRLWVHRSMLMSAETALVTAEADEAVLRAKPSEGARGRARLAPGVLADVLACEGAWCRLRAGDFKGWLPRAALWGVESAEG